MCRCRCRDRSICCCCLSKACVGVVCCSPGRSFPPALAACTTTIHPVPPHCVCLATGIARAIVRVHVSSSARRSALAGRARLAVHVDARAAAYSSCVQKRAAAGITFGLVTPSLGSLAVCPVWVVWCDLCFGLVPCAGITVSCPCLDAGCTVSWPWTPCGCGQCQHTSH